MPLYAIVFFIVAFSLIGYFIYKTGASSPDEIPVDEDLELPEGVVDFSVTDYVGCRLLKVYYATLNDNEETTEDYHAVDTGVFLEFENNRWVNISYNDVLDLFQIDRQSPFTMALEYDLVPQNDHQQWLPLIGATLISIDLQIREERGFSLPRDLILTFSNQQIFISLVAERATSIEQFSFGMDQLIIFFDRGAFYKLRTQ